MTRFRRSGTNWEGRAWVTSPAINSLMDEIEAEFPARHPADGTVASKNHDANNPLSDHRPFPYIGAGVVNAVDAGETVEGQGEELFQALRRSRDKRLRYVIHERRLFSSYTSSSGVPPWTVRPYGGSGHLDHVHTSVLRVHQNDGGEWRLFEEEEMPTLEEIETLVRQVVREEVGQASWGGAYTMPDPSSPTGLHPNTVLRIARRDASTALAILREMADSGRTLTKADIDAIVAEVSESFGIAQRDDD